MEKKEETEKATKDNSFGIAGVIFGILSILSLSVEGIVIGIIGLIFSLRQKKVMKNQWSKVGIILNIIGIVVGIIATYLLYNYFLGEYINQFPNIYKQQ